jgi:5-methylcytosine-specific restriction endonuclease McrA
MENYEQLKDRRKMSSRLRYKVLSRDRFRCVLCGRSPATDLEVILHIDHIIPVSKGGKSNPENLQTLCMECNYGKGGE